jgi:succinylglutamate desuccinylase
VSGRHDALRFASVLREFLTVAHDAVARGVATWVCDHEPFVLRVHDSSVRQPRPTLVLGTLIHGNEYGPLEAVVPWLRDLAPSPSVDLVVVVANTSAAERGLRFVDADLNRLFVPDDPSALVGAPTNHGHEQGLANVLRPILSAPEVVAFVDLHQTIEATDRSFFIFGFHGHSWDLAQRLSQGVASTLVTRPPGQAFVAGQMSGDELVRQLGRPAITIELGQKGFDDDTTRRTSAVLGHLQELLNKEWPQGGVTRPEASSDLEVFTVLARVACDGPLAILHPGFVNFAPVAKGQILGTGHGGQPLVSPHDGWLLFPKYPQRDKAGAIDGPLPGDMVNVLARVSDETLEGWRLPGAHYSLLSVSR